MSELNLQCLLALRHGLMLSLSYILVSTLYWEGPGTNFLLFLIISVKFTSFALGYVYSLLPSFVFLQACSVLYWPGAIEEFLVILSILLSVDFSFCFQILAHFSFLSGIVYLILCLCPKPVCCPYHLADSMNPQILSD